RRRGRVPAAGRPAPLADAPRGERPPAGPGRRAGRRRLGRYRGLGRARGSTVIRLRGVRLATEPPTTALHDLTVEAGRIVAIQPAGRAPQDGSATLDGGGRLAMPGFVDAHAHVEGALFAEEVQHALLRQGVTTVVVGNDGVSCAPAPGPTRSEERRVGKDESAEDRTT